MDEQDLLRTMRAEVGQPSRQELAPARDRLLARMRANKRFASWLLPSRTFTRVATASTLSVALAGGLIASQTFDFGGGTGRPGGPGSADPAAVANADVLLERAAKAAKDDSLPPAKPGEYTYQEFRRKERSRESGKVQVIVTRLWLPVTGGTRPVMRKRKYVKGPGPQLFLVGNPCTSDGYQAETIRNRLDELPADFRRRMRQQLPEKPSEMSRRELCSARLGEQRFLQAAREAYRSMQWHVEKEEAAREGTFQQSTYAFVRSLPTDPDKLADRLRARSRKNSDGCCSPITLAMFTLEDTVVPPDTAAALFKAMQRFDGVKVQRDVTLAASGETGVAIVTQQRVPMPNSQGSGVENKPVREMLVFDSRSYDLLGTQRLAVTGKGDKESTKLLSSRAIRKQAIVPEMGKLPEQSSG